MNEDSMWATCALLELAFEGLGKEVLAPVLEESTVVLVLDRFEYVELIEQLIKDMPD